MINIYIYDVILSIAVLILSISWIFYFVIVIWHICDK